MAHSRLPRAECRTPKGKWYTSAHRMLLCYELPLYLKMIYTVTGVAAEDIDARQTIG